MSVWIENEGPEKDVVVSSRVRLARNFAGLAFPNRMSETEREESLARCREFALKNDFKCIQMRDISHMEREMLVERHIASPDVVNHAYGAVAMSNDELISVMFNEEDHLRIQAFAPGYNTQKALDEAIAKDVEISCQWQYAYDDQFGFLTCCPTNVGTGLRISVMLHLPVLSMTNNIQRTFQSVAKVGMTVRGIYGEGTDALGNMYQLSNQMTLGQSETEILRTLNAACDQIIKNERTVRLLMFKNQRLEFEDMVHRALGTLTHARRMGTREYMRLLSDVRLGIYCKIISDLPPRIVDRLIVEGSSHHLEVRAKRGLTFMERDMERAKLARQMLTTKEEIQ